MADYSSGLGWSDAQWEKVNKAVTEAFDKASVASAFLPRYGPLAESAENVRKEKLLHPEDALLRVSDDTTLKLFTLRLHVELSSEQTADESLSSALLAFRRAANTLAQTEDEIVFKGYGPTSEESYPQEVEDNKWVEAAQQKVADVEGKVAAAQLQLDESRKSGVSKKDIDKAEHALKELRIKLDGTQARALTTASTTPFVASSHATRSKGLAEPDVAIPQALTFSAAGRPVGEAGNEIVNGVVKAIGDLEGEFHPGPFACVLGKRLFEEAHRPKDSMVLPADRITPMLNGPLLRSSRMSDNRGIVVSLGSDAIDIVVATPARAQFLQRKDNAKYLFRLYEKFVLRIKDKRNPAVKAFQVLF